MYGFAEASNFRLTDFGGQIQSTLEKSSSIDLIIFQPCFFIENLSLAAVLMIMKVVMMAMTMTAAVNLARHFSQYKFTVKQLHFRDFSFQ